ncbi:proteoglycan Cow [Arctopsyche grandis]|uniref:proteoglycan Cow n=1 Tax=Arctopsyche grandis TaxID=121162 RepID=UPI00406D8F6E
MRLAWTGVVVALALLFVSVSLADAKKKKKFDGDFEFAEEDESKVISSSKIGEKKRWIYDPNSDLCHPLNCQKKEICLLKDSYTAICVSKKELHKNGDIVVPGGSVGVSMPTNENVKDSSDKDDDVFYDSEDETEDQTDTFACEGCPVVRPVFLCGSDNRTYSSLCRLDYHNCIHHTSVKVACKGFCPCKDPEKKYRNKQQKLSADRRAKKQQGNTSHHSHTQYSFTPEDFKYDNKHYKYIKYTKYNNQLMQEKARENSFNEVVDSKPNRVSSAHDNNIWDESNSSENVIKSNGCSGSALESMADRLLDWFAVLMNDNNKKHTPHYQSSKGFPSDCKVEVRWMFGHLDRDTDSKLSVKDLYSLEHDEQEHCMKPFLSGCDTNHDTLVTRGEWCRCFQKADRPCTAVTRRANRNHFIGAYIPQCDSLGFYRPLQCHGAVGVCWCTDKHGNERPGTRTKGEPRCPESDDAVSLPSDDEDGAGEGSADQPLDF